MHLFPPPLLPQVISFDRIGALSTFPVPGLPTRRQGAREVVGEVQGRVCTVLVVLTMSKGESYFGC